MMMALSIRNPWAYLLVLGVSDVENRTWSTDYRGPLLIHATPGDDGVLRRLALVDDFFLHAKDAPPGCEYADASGCRHLANDPDTGHVILRPEARTRFHEDQYRLLRWLWDSEQEMLDRAIIGQVTLTDVVRDSPSPWADSGCYHWLVSEPELFAQPILQVRGRLKLWDFQSGGEPCPKAEASPHREAGGGS